MVLSILPKTLTVSQAANTFFFFYYVTVLAQ